MSRFEVIAILSLNTLLLTVGKYYKTTARKKGAVKMNYVQIENLPKIQLNFSSSRFEETLLEALDQTFSKLGEEVKQKFYLFLDVNFKISKENIPDRIGDFVYALESIFGTSASLLEMDIMKALRQSVPSFTCVVEGPELSFEGYLFSLKRYIENI